MKTLSIQLAILVVFVLNSFLFSQNALMNGNYSLGGSISYSNTKSTSSNVISDFRLKTNEIFAAPSFGYFIIDNLLIGANISFIYSEIKNESSFRISTPGLDILSTTTIRRQFGIGPTVRYYFTGFKIIPFVEAGYGYSKEFSSEKTGNIFTFGVGVNYFISECVALEPFLSYLTASYSNPASDNNMFSIGIRINYYIISY